MGATARRLLRALRHPTDAEGRCAHCRHFADDREEVERELPGLLVLSSGFGDSWGDAGICRRHELMLLPFNSCEDFSPTTLSTGSSSDEAYGSSSDEA